MLASTFVFMKFSLSTAPIYKQNVFGSFHHYQFYNSKKNAVIVLQSYLFQHEEICKFPSKHFYDGRLETHLSVKRRICPETKLKFWPRGPQMPIMFCNIVGKEVQVGSSKSNPEEAEKAVSL